MKRTAILFLMLAAALCILCSCGNNAPAETTPAVTDAPITDAPAKNVVISSPEGCDYIIVVKKGTSESVNAAANDLRSKCYEMTDNQLWVKRDESQTETAKEILIGDTNRPESAEAAKGLEANQYVIKFIGEKLVVAGGSRSAVAYGTKELIKLFGEQSGTIALPENINVTGEIDMKSVTDLESGWNALTFEASNNVDLLYQIWLPKGYSAEKEYPCILYMHSAGVRCNDNSHINTGEAKFLRNLENGKYAKEVIVIAPCCPESEKWIPAGAWNNITYDFINTKPTAYMTATMELFNSYIEQLSIDKDRLYTYGMSMGAFAVWDLLTRNPGIFAAAIPVAGAGDPNAAASMGSTAIWMFHGTADEAVPMASAKAMNDALTAAGRTDVKFTVFEGAGHGIWAMTADTEGLFDWLFSQSLDK